MSEDNTKGEQTPLIWVHSRDSQFRIAMLAGTREVVHDFYKQFKEIQADRLGFDDVRKLKLGTTRPNISHVIDTGLRLMTLFGAELSLRLTHDEISIEQFFEAVVECQKNNTTN